MLCMCIHVCGHTHTFGYMSPEQKMRRCPTNGYHVGLVGCWVSGKKGSHEEKTVQVGKVR